MTIKRLAMTALLLFTLSLSLAQAAVKTRIADEPRQTLKEIRASAVAVEDEADELRRINAFPGLSPESSLARLVFLKETVNKMGKELSGLEAERDSLTPEQREAVDKTLPLLQEITTNTQGAIEYFNDNRSHLWMDGNRGYADRIYGESKQLAATLRDYLKYDTVRNQAQRLEQSPL